jgi:hypothetical protein
MLIRREDGTLTSKEPLALRRGRDGKNFMKN